MVKDNKWFCSQIMHLKKMILQVGITEDKDKPNKFMFQKKEEVETFIL
jgi:hypothetical protein